MMSIVLALLQQATAAPIPPPPPPPVPQPTSFPEYVAQCYLVGPKGERTSADLTVAGQGQTRSMRLRLDPGVAAWPASLEVKSTAMALVSLTDGRYRYNEFGRPNGDEFLQLEAEGLGPTPDILRIELKRAPKTPVFEQPGLIGACTIKANSEVRP